MPQSVHEMKDFERIKLLGEGGFGQVYKAKRKTDGLLFAIKIVDEVMKPEQAETVKKEGIILSKLENPFIVQYYDLFVEDGSLHMVLELCAGDMEQRVKKFGQKLVPKEKILDWTAQITIALDYLHEKRIIHRDLKPQNILLTKADTCKLADFGLVRILPTIHTVETKSQAGTLRYMAPEMLDTTRKVSMKLDIWSFGCVVYYMSTNEDLFPTVVQRPVGRIKHIDRKDFKDIQLLVEQMLKEERSERPTTKQLRQHPSLSNTFHSMNESNGSSLRGESSNKQKEMPKEEKDWSWNKIEPTTLSYNEMVLSEVTSHWRKLTESIEYIPYNFRIPSRGGIVIVGTVCRDAALKTISVGAAVHPNAPSSLPSFSCKMRVKVLWKRKRLEQWESFEKEGKVRISHCTNLSNDAKKMSLLFQFDLIDCQATSFCATPKVILQLLKD